MDAYYILTSIGLLKKPAKQAAAPPSIKSIHCDVTGFCGPRKSRLCVRHTNTKCNNSSKVCEKGRFEVATYLALFSVRCADFFFLD